MVLTRILALLLMGCSLALVSAIFFLDVLPIEKKDGEQGAGEVLSASLCNHRARGAPADAQLFSSATTLPAFNSLKVTVGCFASASPLIEIECSVPSFSTTLSSLSERASTVCIMAASFSSKGSMMVRKWVDFPVVRVL